MLRSVSALSTLKVAYDYESSNTSGYYPYATLTLKQGSGRFESSSHNTRTTVFSIRVYQEQTKSGQGPQMAEQIAVDVLDELTTHFDMVPTLSGVVKWVRPVSWSATYTDRERDTRVLEVEVEAVDVVNSL